MIDEINKEREGKEKMKEFWKKRKRKLKDEDVQLCREKKDKKYKIKGN